MERVRNAISTGGKMIFKRILANLLILIVAAAVVFYIGWVQFLIKPGNCGVMVSKTGGVYEKPILPGVFDWRWERLLPTNVTLHSYSLEPYKSTQRFSGTLPSAEIYAGLLEQSPDFSYNIAIDVMLSVKQDALVPLVKSNVVQNPENLQEFFESKAKVVAQQIADSLLAETATTIHIQRKVLTSAELSKLVAAFSDDFSSIIVHSVEITDAKLPDFKLYGDARTLYEGYQKDLKDSLRERAEQHAFDVYENDKTVELLERYAKLVKKYPQLKDVQNVATAADALKTFQEKANALESVPEEQAASAEAEDAAEEAHTQAADTTAEEPKAEGD